MALPGELKRMQLVMNTIFRHLSFFLNSVHYKINNNIQMTLNPCAHLVDGWLLVEEDDIKHAIKFMLDEHHKVR